MCKFSLISLLLIFQYSNSVKYDGMEQIMTNFLIRRHVHSVTANTCWPCNFHEKFLKHFSSNDISVSFCPSMQQTHVTWYRQAFLVNLSCEKSKNIFKKISNDRLFNMQNDWILFGKNVASNTTNTTSLALKIFETYLGDAYVLPDSGVFLFQEIDNDVWEIWNGFRFSISDTMRVFKIGSTSPNNLNANDLYAERRNFHGVTLRANAVIIERDQFFGFHIKAGSDLDIFSHMHNEMIDILSRQLNFKIALGINDEYGWLFENGTFGGLMGTLQRNEIDLSTSGVLFRADRMAVVDYTIATMPFRVTALFRQPQLSSVHNILLLPFALELWLVILAISFIFVFILVLLTRTNNRLNIKRESSLNIQEIIIMVHGAICQQGISYTSNLESIRVAVFVLFLTTLFVFTSYSASISALIQSNSNSIRSIRDIVESPMTFNAQMSSYGKYYFEETDDPLIKTLYKTKMIPIGNKAFVKASNGIEKIRTEFHGFMVEIISAYKIISNEWREEEKCGLADIQLFRFAPLSIPLVKNSGHKDLFKQKLIQQMEVGVIKRITNQWISPKPSCGSSSRSKVFISVSITDIYLTLNVFGCGVILSLGILTLEIVCHNWINRRCKDEIVHCKFHARRF